MANTAAYLEFVQEQLGALGRITSRAMFGGHCLYCDGVVFALLANNELYLKVDKEIREKFTGRGLKPFHPFEKDEFVMSYYQAPPELLDNADAVLEWGGAAVGASRRAARANPARSGRRNRSRPANRGGSLSY